MGHRFRHADPRNPATKQRRASYNTAEYRAAGRACTTQVKQGNARCWRCHRPIPPSAKRGEHWVVGHADHDRSIIKGVECYHCNSHTAAVLGNRAQARRHPHLRRKVRKIRPLSL